MKLHDSIKQSCASRPLRWTTSRAAGAAAQVADCLSHVEATEVLLFFLSVLFCSDR